MAYPKPEFPIGYVVHNCLDEPLTVVAQIRTDRIMAWGDRRLFSDESAKRTPWFYTLRDCEGKESSISEGGLRHQEQAMAALRAPAHAEQSKVSPTQPGRMLNVGERLRSPHGTWTVARAHRLYEKSERGMGRQYCTYLLTHEDGHQEEWRARDMADADFHLILDDRQQTLM
jgi:hypothetical protein